jgi:CBS domain containing-hemolysin-like protein
VAVALLAGSFGYALGVGLLTAIGLDFGFIVWLVGIVAAVAVAAAVLYFNIQKYAVILITALGGTGVIVYTLLAAFGDPSLVELMFAPVLLALQDSFWWLLFFIVVAGTGVYVQLQANKDFEAEAYNRMAS